MATVSTDMWQTFTKSFVNAFVGQKREKIIDRGRPSAQSVLTTLQGGQYTSTGLNRNALELAKAYKNSPSLRRAVGLISQSLARVPWILKRRRARKSTRDAIPRHVRTLSNPEYRQKVLHTLDSEYETVYDHPFLDFLSVGSPLLPGNAGLRASYCYKELKGEYFWLLSGAAKKPPSNWTLIPPHWVIDLPTISNGGNYKLQINGKTEQVSSELIFWSRDPDLVDPYGRGAGTGETLADEIDGDEWAAQLMRQLISNKGFMDVLIALQDADEATIREVDARYNKDHRGVMSAGRALIFDAKSIEVKPITHPLSELKLLELRDFERKIVGQTYGIPSEIIGDVENRTRATIEGAERVFSQYALLPRLEAQRLDMQVQLLPLWDVKGEYMLDYISPMPEDEEQRLNIMKEQPMAFTLNEWRAAAGFGPERWGNTRDVPFANVEVDAGNNELKRANENKSDLAPQPPKDIDDEPIE